MTTNDITVPLKQDDADSAVPSCAYSGDAGVDLRANEDAVLMPSERKVVGCGIAMALPEGYAGFVLPRSGLAAKHGITVVNAPGLIDSNYRGEIKVILLNTDTEHAFSISKGDRIAQLVVLPVPNVTFEVVSDLPDSNRGTGGFGSSGV